VILVDHLHGHKPLAGVGERDGDPPGVEVEHAERIQGVPVQPDHRLAVDLGELALMMELAKPAFLHEPGEVHVAFGAAEVIDGHAHRFPVIGRRRHKPTSHDEDCGGDRHGCCTHDVLPS
jgi:hypothetical protein